MPIPDRKGSHGRRRFPVILVFIFLISSFTVRVFSQFYEYGQDAGNIRWSQIYSDHYHVIYPRHLDSVAMKFADRLEYFYPFQAAAMDYEHGRMPVVIHNESSFSNGVFVWAPRRLEIFTNPDPNGYPQDWLTQLAIHEGRHAFQVSKLNQGFSKGLSFIAGEQAVGAVTGFLPMWYLEGDAVDTETRFSHTGRGRMPSFEMGMKAILLEKGRRYSFSKALLGSYRDYTPNHYQLGYLMVRYGRRTFGNRLWTDMEDYVARKPYLVVPTLISMRKYGIRSKLSFYNNTLDFYASHWATELEKRKLTEMDRWSSPSGSYTSYDFTQWIADSMMLALKTGIDQIPEFVTLDSLGHEKRVFRPGFLNSGRFSYSHGLLAWDEWVPDIRWSNRNFSIIRIHDMETGHTWNLGSRTRYYAPSLSHDGKYITTIEQQTNQTFYLVVLDTCGKILQHVPSPGNLYIQQPSWTENDSAIVCTMNDAHGEYLVLYSLSDTTWKKLYDAGFNDISYPVVNGSSVYFTGTFSGIDNIYCYGMDTDSAWQVTSSAFGAFDPSVNRAGDRISYSDYHADGYRAVSLALDKGLWRNVNNIPAKREQIDYESTAAEDSIIAGEKNITSGTYDPLPYRKLAHAVHVHSWLPLYFDYMNPEAALTPEEFPLSPGFTLLSQNLLSTVTGMLGYEYRDKMHYIHSGLRLKGRWPVADLSFDYGGYPQVYKIDNSQVSIRPDRVVFNANVTIPLRFNTGKYITYMQPVIGYSYSSDFFYDPDIPGYAAGNDRLTYSFYFGSYLRKGRKDILPRAGVIAFGYFRHAPFDHYNLGSLAAGGISVYVPGVLRHQALKLSYTQQVQHPLRFMYGNMIAMPRGMSVIQGLNMKMLSADYAFPILYPDLNIEPVLYLKRIRGNLWVDYLIGRDIMLTNPDRREDVNYSSFGVDLLADLHFLRIFFPISIGSRVAYLANTETWKAELLLNIDVN